MRVLMSATPLAILCCLALVLSSCGGDDSDSQSSPTAFKSGVQTAIPQAQEAGITIYWLGERIEAVGDGFRFTGNAGYADVGNQLPSFDLEYWERGEQATLYVTTFPPDETHGLGRQMWLANEGATQEPVELSGWTGEIISVPKDDGQFHLIVFLHGEEAAVSIRTNTTEDFSSSPLNDPEQLLAIIEENLRPFPE